MPLYEYECNDCGHRFERIQKFSDPLVSTCPVCDGEVRKLLSSPAIQFKGTGWYVTDYAKKPRGDAQDGGERKAAGDAQDGGERKAAGDAKGTNGKDTSAAASKDASSSTPKKESTASTTRSTSGSAAAR